MAIFPHHPPISTASCAPHQQHRIIIPSASPERLQRERFVALEFLSGFQKKAHEQNLRLVDLSFDEMRFLGRAIAENTGLAQGFFAGALTLVTLRRGPIYMARYLVQKHHHHEWGPSHNLSKSNSPFHSNNNNNNNNNNNPMIVPNESPLMKAGWWLIDLTLSCAGAIMAATATTNQEELFMTLSQIPRVLPESSRIADSFCPQAMLMLQEMKSRKRNNDDDDDETTTAALLESPPQSVMLQAMMDFTTACQQRENRKEFFAQRHREQQGIIMNDDDDFVVKDDDDADSTTSNWDDTTRG